MFVIRIDNLKGIPLLCPLSLPLLSLLMIPTIGDFLRERDSLCNCIFIKAHKRPGQVMSFRHLLLPILCLLVSHAAINNNMSICQIALPIFLFFSAFFFCLLLFALLGKSTFSGSSMTAPFLCVLQCRVTSSSPFFAFGSDSALCSIVIGHVISTHNTQNSAVRTFTRMCVYVCSSL